MGCKNYRTIEIDSKVVETRGCYSSKQTIESMVLLLVIAWLPSTMNVMTGIDRLLERHGDSWLHIGHK